ncbi:putative nucleic acid-binding protein [Pararhizobium capsulatum DSM 1112]|uniref:Nucleic acid-binding protein n=1 Tax=Pararhizobium capsulatum DSM 1112 TaxID=1121113 RepID=A0ABU0BV57_9HYPH|nr:type II toxin-antitoxin system VapC family toxin [Pararhizobium capsulatum]MDQ0322137.1 putative nucleic acid-binding protein [Pararhizobium capsulatum DSM 1112]
MTLVDTNVLLDVVSNDPVWADWSIEQLEAAALRGPLLINDIVYAELSVRYERVESLEDFIAEAGIEMAPLSRPALFLAAKVFTSYRKAGGARTGVLPDFFIGAQAAVEGLDLLTRDTARYRSYFPTVKLIAPGR